MDNLSKWHQAYSRHAFLQSGLRKIEVRESSVEIEANGPKITEDLLENFAIRISCGQVVLLKFRVIKALVQHRDESGSRAILHLPITLPADKVVEVSFGLLGQDASLRKYRIVHHDVPAVQKKSG